MSNFALTGRRPECDSFMDSDLNTKVGTETHRNAVRKFKTLLNSPFDARFELPSFTVDDIKGYIIKLADVGLTNLYDNGYRPGIIK